MSSARAAFVGLQTKTKTKPKEAPRSLGGVGHVDRRMRHWCQLQVHDVSGVCHWWKRQAFRHAQRHAQSDGPQCDMGLAPSLRLTLAAGGERETDREREMALLSKLH